MVQAFGMQVNMKHKHQKFISVHFPQKRDDSGASVSLQKVRSRPLQLYLSTPRIRTGLVARIDQTKF